MPDLDDHWGETGRADCGSAAVSSVIRVPEARATDGGRLTAHDAWRILRDLGAVSLVRESLVRFRYGDGFSHARALGLQLSLAAIPRGTHAHFAYLDQSLLVIDASSEDSAPRIKR